MVAPVGGDYADAIRHRQRVFTASDVVTAAAAAAAAVHAAAVHGGVISPVTAAAAAQQALDTLPPLPAAGGAGAAAAGAAAFVGHPCFHPSAFQGVFPPQVGVRTRAAAFVPTSVGLNGARPRDGSSSRSPPLSPRSGNTPPPVMPEATGKAKQKPGKKQKTLLRATTLSAEWGPCGRLDALPELVSAGGSGVIDSVADGDKSFELRGVHSLLVFPDGSTQLLREFVGKYVVLAEHSRGEDRRLVLQIGPRATFASRGAAVAHHRGKVLPGRLLSRLTEPDMEARLLRKGDGRETARGLMGAYVEYSEKWGDAAYGFAFGSRADEKALCFSVTPIGWMLNRQVDARPPVSRRSAVATSPSTTRRWT